MNKPEKLQLIYFKLRALAEPPQMMMRFAGLEYSYEMAWDYYGRLWADAKLDIVFGQLPILVVNENNQIWQSGSIVRFLANITGTNPKDRYLAAQVDSLFDQTQELFFPLNPTVNFRIGEDHLKLKNEFLKSFPKTLGNYAKFLEIYKSGPFFFGETTYYCDFSAYHHFSLATILQKDILNDQPLIIEFMNSVENLPGIKKYLDERPEIIDVGTAPKLIINGSPSPTGTEES